MKAAAVRAPRSWPVLLLAAPAFAAIWSGWVGLGELTGFGLVHPLPGIWDSATVNTAITLPIGVETYAAYALNIWLARAVDGRARRFAKISALGSLVLGAGGQVAYHLMAAARITHAPWLITALVACLPVLVLGMGAALAHLVAEPGDAEADGEMDAMLGELAERTQERDGARTEAEELRDLLQLSQNETTQAMARVDDLAEELRAAIRAAEAAKPNPGGGGSARAGSRSAGPKVIALRAKYPDWTVERIAQKADVDVRTARRHLNADKNRPTTTAPGDADTVSAAAA